MKPIWETMHVLVFIGKLIVGSFTTLSAEFPNNSSSNNSDGWFFKWYMRIGNQAHSLSKAQPLPIHSWCWIQACFLALWIERASCLPVSAAAGCHPIIGNYVEMTAQRAAFLKWLFLLCWLGKAPQTGSRASLSERTRREMLLSVHLGSVPELGQWSQNRLGTRQWQPHLRTPFL